MLDGSFASRKDTKRRVIVMQQGSSEKVLAEARRREIFSALVEAQDQRMTVAQSREEVAKRFSLSQGQLRQIEREGLDNKWPPL
jgi:hypothetical protein